MTIANEFWVSSFFNDWIKIGKSLIEILLYRLSLSKKIHKIILATTNNEIDDVLVDQVKKIGYDVYRGDENNVLERFHEAGKRFSADIIVRITGDCPLIDPSLVDDVIALFNNNKLDYASNTNPPTFPDGLDISVFSFRTLNKTLKGASTEFDKEHVTPYMKRQNKFKKSCLKYKKDLSSERWTVDHLEDFIVIENIIK